jgi:N-acetylglutamate synthase-like GNAT family acetyltransferase
MAQLIRSTIMNISSTDNSLQNNCAYPSDASIDPNVHLSDGSVVTIRPIRRDDGELERAFIENLSNESRYHRFLCGMVHPSSDLIKKLVEIDHDRDEAYVALGEQDGKTVLIGVSRYFSDQDGKSCECAVVVADAWQHKGLGTLLMQRLIKTAKARNIQRMYSIDSVENSDMYDFAAHMGFKRESNSDDLTQVTHTLIL